MSNPDTLEEDLDELEDEYCRKMATICADPSMDFDFWKNGEYPITLPLEILSGIMLLL